MAETEFLVITPLGLRLGDKFNAEANLNYNRLNLPNGSTDVVITGGRLAYSFTPRMFLQSLVQYNNVSRITSVNARFGLFAEMPIRDFLWWSISSGITILTTA